MQTPGTSGDDSHPNNHNHHNNNNWSCCGVEESLLRSLSGSEDRRSHDGRESAAIDPSPSSDTPFSLRPLPSSVLQVSTTAWVYRCTPVEVQSSAVKGEGDPLLFLFFVTKEKR
ncbi:hypothetical protein AGDE_14122 [Angomonas deanei]|uniref:Uncharacterized protein n=1 Tax=Angomonas deanei TaxID=59799 RepID=A0A7G2CRC1_9TRYP|nr:hypothetical protein AGDE_14122 [Angomonas deanei]CAD2221929.1 hypothetical protein, conserved [Angomonas deanei]|eukprot:EPY21352.1 hypothetical protein AGDE_14122 [Angomonas deanei]